MINKNCKDFQYISGDLVYIISPLTSQLRANSRKVTIKYVGLLVVYKIVDPHILPAVALSLAKIINISLEHGIFAAAWKIAIIRPLLKKVGLDLY